MGISLGGKNFWSTQWIYVDVLKQSSEWISNYAPDLVPKDLRYTWNKGPRPSLDPDGFPTHLQYTQQLGKLMMRDVYLHAPAGRYVCLFDGEGELQFGMDAAIVSYAKGRVEIDYSPTGDIQCFAQFESSYCSDNGLWVLLVTTNPANPIRNLRIIMPGFLNTYTMRPFHPLFLKMLERFSVIRFGDWQKVNSAVDTTWEMRTRPGQDGGMDKPVPLEDMLLLSNTLGASPWFSIPHTVDDHYVREFAKAVLVGLRTDCKVYVEHSNEVWNTLFSQGVYARERGMELGLSDDPALAGYRYHGMRTAQIAQIFREVFGT